MSLGRILEFLSQVHLKVF